MDSQAAADALDVKYATDARGPLHHDNRCTNHGED
jgi:hypothetical protein